MGCVKSITGHTTNTNQLYNIIYCRQSYNQTTNPIMIPFHNSYSQSQFNKQPQNDQFSN